MRWSQLLLLIVSWLLLLLLLLLLWLAIRHSWQRLQNAHELLHLLRECRGTPLRLLPCRCLLQRPKLNRHLSAVD